MAHLNAVTQTMPSSTRRSSTRRTPRGLFGNIGLMAVHSMFAEFAAAGSEAPVSKLE